MSGSCFEMKPPVQWLNSFLLFLLVSEFFCYLSSQMTGNDNEGSKSVYGSDVEIVTNESTASKSATASNKV